MLSFHPHSLNTTHTALRLLKFAGTTAGVIALAVIGSDFSPARAAELTRTADVDASVDTVWSVIGGFCAIKDWHPVVGSCVEDGKTPPTRTLVTKDGKVTFVEMQTARDEAAHSYSYNFIQSPFPVTAYIGTISVSAKDETHSTITWHGEYAPVAGKEADADAAFASVYEPGLAALKEKFAK